MKRIRKWFLTGLVVMLPMVVTAWVLWRLFSSVDKILAPVVAEALGFPLPGLGFVTVMVLIILIGFFAGNLVGRKTLALFERIIDRVPVIGKVYNAVRQLLEVFSKPQRDSFQQVVSFQYPRPGIWSLGFVTHESSAELHGQQGRELVNVFLPTSPNPTSGFFLMVPVEDIFYPDINVEEALKLIVSGGAYEPCIGSGTPPAAEQ